MNPIHRLESMNSHNLDRTITPLCITTDGSVYPMTTNIKLFRHTIAKEAPFIIESQLFDRSKVQPRRSRLGSCNPVANPPEISIPGGPYPSSWGR